MSLLYLKVTHKIQKIIYIKENFFAYLVHFLFKKMIYKRSFFFTLDKDMQRKYIYIFLNKFLQICTNFISFCNGISPIIFHNKNFLTKIYLYAYFSFFNLPTCALKLLYTYSYHITFLRLLIVAASVWSQRK